MGVVFFVSSLSHHLSEKVGCTYRKTYRKTYIHIHTNAGTCVHACIPYTYTYIHTCIKNTYIHTDRHQHPVGRFVCSLHFSFFFILFFCSDFQQVPILFLGKYQSHPVWEIRIDGAILFSCVRPIPTSIHTRLPTHLHTHKPSYVSSYASAYVPT